MNLYTRAFRLFFFLGCALVILAKPARGQNYSYVNYNTKDGLAGSIVYCAVQDRDGFIWFGTETGLSRFDGTRFVNFTTADGLPDNEVINLFVDSKNRVWICAFTNKFCYYYNGKIYNEKNDSLISRLQLTENVSWMAENKKGELAFVEGHRIIIIKPDNSFFRVKCLPAGQHRIGHVGLDFDSTFLFSDNPNRVNTFYLSKVYGDTLLPVRELKHYDIVTVNANLLGPKIRTLYKKDSIEFTAPGKQFAIQAPAGIISLTRLNDSLVAINTFLDTYTYNYITGKEEHRFFSKKSVSSAMEDREGNLWFCTMGDGVYRFPSTRFNNLQFEASGSVLSVNSLKKTGDSLLIGTDRFQVWTLNMVNNRLTSMQLLRRASRGRIMAIDKFPDGQLIFGTDLGLYAGSKNKFELVGNQLTPVKAMQIAGDTIIASTGLATICYKGIPDEKRWNLLHIRNTALVKQANIIYIGTLQGLFAVRDNEAPRYLGDRHPTLASRISVLANGHNGTIWVGTYGHGLVAFREGKVVAVINSDSGLTSNIVRSVCIAGNSVWAGTDKGLNKVQFRDGAYHVRRFTESDGLLSNMINTVMVDGNRVYAGTPKGLTWFAEDQVFTRSMCELRITGISSAKRQEISGRSNLLFDHYDNNIRFEFTGISFKSGGEITYRYRLHGLDTTWQTTTNNFLIYPTLPSGRYLLQLQAVNKFGITSETASISFEIARLIHEKAWFRILVVAIVVFGVWAFIRYRVRKIRRVEQARSETRRKIAGLEQMALRAQMNPHFIFNCLNSIQQYVFDTDIEGANQFITEFSRLVRLTLDLSAQERISLEAEVDYLNTYLALEKRRFENKFAYHIDIANEIDPPKVYIPPMMLQPYIENSIRHGLRYRNDDGGKLIVQFSTYNGYLQCRVEDNGIGRARSQELKGTMHVEYQSRGMSLTAKRIEMINKSFTLPIDIRIDDVISDGEVAGTVVLIQIPLEKTPSLSMNL